MPRPGSSAKIHMTAAEVDEARRKLGEAWGLDRPLALAEMGRALRFSGRDPGASVKDLIDGKSAVSGPVSVALSMMLAGAMPPDALDIILTKPGRPKALDRS